MEAVGPEDTGFPPFLTITGKFGATTERYSDNAVMVGVTEESVCAAATPPRRGGSAIQSAPCTKEGGVLEHPMGCPGKSEFGGLTRLALRESGPADGAPRPPSAGLPGVPRCVRDKGTSSSSRRGGDVERGAGTGIHREGHGPVVPRTRGLAGGGAGASVYVIKEERVQDGGPGRQDMAETFAPACTNRLFDTMACIGQGAAGQTPAHSGTWVESAYAATTHEWPMQCLRGVGRAHVVEAGGGFRGGSVGEASRRDLGRSGGHDGGPKTRWTQGDLVAAIGGVDPPSNRSTSDGVYRCEPPGDEAGCRHRTGTSCADR